MSRTIVTTSLAALAFAALATPALASEPTIKVTEVVRYTDLDLTSLTGAQTMIRRIEAAVDRACAQPDTPVLPRAEAGVRACRQRALPRAIARLHAPLVSAEYARLHGDERSAMAVR